MHPTTLIDYKLQLIIIGDSGCGKTTFMDRYCDGQYRVSYNATVGIDFKVKTIMSKNNKKVKLQIWDTAGQEKFNSITTAYYRNARGAIIMYDVTREETFENLRKWFTLVSQFGRADIEVAIVGNKCDMNTEYCKRQVSREMGEALATEMGCHFFECSAKEDINVTDVFSCLSEEIIRHMPIEQHGIMNNELIRTYGAGSENQAQNQQPQNTGGCCN